MTASAPFTPRRVLILGNLGYIGPVLAAHLRAEFPQAELVGYDTAYFQGCLLDPATSADRLVHRQFYGDIRALEDSALSGVDCVVALAAISNDPMGNRFEQPTYAINSAAILAIAARARAVGVRRFVFASSCSIYGAGGDGAKLETSALNPLTAYARSKVMCEEGLEKLATDTFTVTALRFATACGYSPRLRLDLVLNDFVASALMHRRIEILSDGTPWRPLIHVRDMSRAIGWALTRAVGAQGGAFLAINTGADAWNVTIRALAEKVAAAVGGVEVDINLNAAPDKRSYRVDFAQFRALAPAHQPLHTLEGTIAELFTQLQAMGFAQKEFRAGHLMRLNTLNALLNRGTIDAELHWTDGN